MSIPGREKQHSALGSRFTTSAVAVPAIGFLFYVDHRFGPTALPLLGLFLVLVLFSVRELASLLKKAALHPHTPAAMFCALAVVAAGWFERIRVAPESVQPDVAALAPVMIAYTLSILVLFLNTALRFQQPGENLKSLCADLLIVSYVGVLLAVTAQLRWAAGHEAGELVLASLIVAAKSGDIGAYTFGRLFGRRKMVPRLSPGKTWMGAVGALVGAGLGSWAWLHWGPGIFNAAWPSCNSYWSIVFGVVIGLVGLLGDLCESLIKRDVEVKDSATFLPGFGGLLDLLDSMLYAGPVAYFLWVVLPLATWLGE